MPSIRYTVNEDQLLTAKLYNTSINAAIKKRRLLAWLMIPALYGILGYIFWANGRDKMTYFFFAFCFLWILLYPFWEGNRFKRSYRDGLRRNAKGLLEQEQEIDFADQIEIRSKDKTESYHYNELTSVVELTDYYLLLFVKERTIAVPKQEITENLIAFLGKKEIPMLKKTGWKWR